MAFCGDIAHIHGSLTAKCAMNNQEHNAKALEDVHPRYVKSFMAMKMNEGRKPAYVNGLLKAFKVPAPLSGDQAGQRTLHYMAQAMATRCFSPHQIMPQFCGLTMAKKTVMIPPVELC